MNWLDGTDCRLGKRGCFTSVAVANRAFGGNGLSRLVGLGSTLGWKTPAKIINKTVTPVIPANMRSHRIDLPVMERQLIGLLGIAVFAALIGSSTLIRLRY